jgi:sarcosine oxidase
MAAFDADVAVIGLGAMGSNALWRMAARGVDVLGFEQFRPGHVQGSSHGHTRLFRVACLEHPNLVPLAQRSLELWRELAERSGTPIIDVTGGLMIGPRDSDVVAGTLAAARAHDLPVRSLSAGELGAQYPQHAEVPGDHVAVWDPMAGVVRPEAGVIAATQAAAAAGATVYADTRVESVELVDDGTVIVTPTRSFRVRQAVVTAGAWLDKLVPELPLEPIRTPMTWFAPRNGGGEFELERFPIFIRGVADDNWIWGHGAADGFDVKVGPDQDPNFYAVDPDTIDRGISAADSSLISSLVSLALPGLDPTPTRTTTCMITRSPDGQFQIGRPHRDRRLVVGGGCSGHAFKHASGIGEVLAQIVCDETPLIDLDFVDPNRFL